MAFFVEKINVNRDFKGVWIPKEIWLSKNITMVEKFFLLEIDSLDSKKGCFASNAHFSELFGLSKGRCTQVIKQLESKNYIKITLIYEGKQITKRLIKVVNKLNRGIKNIKLGYLENDEGTNTKEQYNHKRIYAFLDFYNKYPKKGTKAEAERFWGKMPEHEKESAINGISNHTEGKEKTYMVDAIRYLRNKRWEDEINKGNNNGSYQQALTPQEQLDNSISETQRYLDSLQ